MELTTQQQIENYSANSKLDERLLANVFEVFKTSAEKFGTKTALRYLPDMANINQSIAFSYQNVFDNIAQLAFVFKEMGASDTSAVSMLLPNIPEMEFAIWAAESVSVANPINPFLEKQHIAGILNQANARVLVLQINEQSAEFIDYLAKNVPSLKHVILFDPLQYQLNNKGAIPSGEKPAHSTKLEITWLHELIVLQQANQQTDTMAPRLNESLKTHQDIAAYFHTGGTTGTPKLAVHSQYNQLANAEQGALVVDFNQHDVALSGLPLFHVNAVIVTAGLTQFKQGAEVILAGADGFRSPELVNQFWQVVDHYKVTYFSGVPKVYQMVLDTYSQNDSLDISSLRVGICGAAPMPVGLFEKFQNTTSIRIVEGYGQTEGTCLSTINPLYGESKIGSVGLPLPWSSVRSVQLDESGQYIRDSAVDETGEVVISGPNVFSGYSQKEKNSDIWLDDHYLKTGDLGRIDEAGYLWLTGRSKDLIIRGGHNIDPSMIEDALYKHPEVEFAAAIGKPDPGSGELPVAYVTLIGGASQQTDASTLIDFVKPLIAERAAIPKEIHIIDVMPTTAVGKIFKPDLRADIIKRTITESLQIEFGHTDHCSLQTKLDSKSGLVLLVSFDRREINQIRLENFLKKYSIIYELIPS